MQGSSSCQEGCPSLVFIYLSLLGLLEKEARRRRIILNQNQKNTLRAWFEKNPNPDLATRGHLAKELGISESQIMVGIRPLSESSSG